MALSSVERFYFDHNATTPVSAEALAALTEALGEVYGNASSIHHQGQKAKQRLEAAREQLARAIGADPQEIVFVSGGTEADNLAIFGMTRALPRERTHVITSAIEHPAALASCAQLEREGAAVTRLAVGASGVVDPDDVRKALRPETALISVMHANNEVGTIQPLAEIAQIAREAGAPFHSDGVQAVGKIPVNVTELGVDLYSLTGHKFYGPKGAGALYVRKGTRLSAIQYGGGHERGRRPGTENVPGAAALAAAADWAVRNLEAETARVRALRDRLEAGILARTPGASIHCADAPRTPNTSSVCFEGVDGEAMVISLDLAGFAVSSGAACSSGAAEPSHVLTAIGLPRERARATLRFSLGRGNDEAQVDALIEAVAAAAARLRQIAPAARHAS